MRPKLPKELKRYPLNITLPYWMVEYLREHPNKSVTIEDSINSSKDFRKWNAERKKLEREAKQPQLI